MRALKLALTALATSRATERVKPLTPVQIDPGGSNHPLYTKQRASNPQTTGYSSKPSNGNDSLEQLLKAIKDNNVTLLAKSISNVADLDIVDEDKLTPLAIASTHGRSDAVKALITAGSNLDIVDNYGRTPLYMAAYYGKIDVVIELIAAGAKLEFVDKDKLTPLAIASANDRSNSVKAIIAAGADINIRDNYGRTPLYIAAVNGRTDTVKTLITAGADIDIRDNDDRTPLSVANRMGYLLSVANRTGDLHTEIAKLLSEKDAHNEAEELKKLMLSFFFAFVIVSCFYNEDRRKERNNVLRREYIEQLENSPVGKLSDQQFSRILNDDMKTLICTISHECLSATNVLAVDGNPNSLYSVDGLSQWLNPKAEANNGTKFHRIDAEGKFRDIYTKNICNIKDVINVTEAISKAFLERVSPIIQSLARGYITRKELRENDLDGSITPIEADDDPANAVGYAAKELERRKAGSGVESQVE